MKKILFTLLFAINSTALFANDETQYKVQFEILKDQEILSSGAIITIANEPAATQISSTEDTSNTIKFSTLIDSQSNSDVITLQGKFGQSTDLNQYHMTTELGELVTISVSDDNNRLTIKVITEIYVP